MKDFVLSNSQQNRSFAIDYENELNKEQFEVVKNGDGAVLVLAGAGSGKTRTITYRVAWLLENGISPQNILLLTFTNKSAREMTERIQNLLGLESVGVWSGTFHSVANRLLRQYAGALGYTANFSILDQDDAKELIGICVKDLKIDTTGKRFPSSAVLKSIISFQMNKNCSMKQVLELKHPKFLPIIEEIDSVSDLYRKLKLEQNSMDFDDLLLNFLKLLKNEPVVRSRLSDNFRYVLVDEFQDTNVIQAEIVSLLVEKHKNILVVGDDAQSIYSFRAAEIRNILNFSKQYNGAKTFKLTQNYRSTPQILSVANAVIKENTEQFSKDLTAVCAKGELPQVVPAENNYQEARFIADKIMSLYEDGMQFSEISVLFRAAYHSQALEFELMKRDIAYDYRGGMKFFERAHIKDALAHLRVFYNVKDGMAWVRALKIQPGIGVVTATKISRQCGSMSSVDEIDQVVVSGKKAQVGWQGLVRILQTMMNGRKNPSDLIRSFISTRDYKNYLENEYPNFHERLDDLEQFALFAEQFDDTASFLEAVSLTDEYGSEKKNNSFNEDRVVLSTIHQAKGLEWDSVFVMNLTEGGFPHARAYDEIEGIEEERRLFYVAITRARKNLFLTYPKTAGYETMEIKQPSIFLEEIPKKSTETIRIKEPAFNNSFGNYGKRRAFNTSKDDGYEEPTIALDSFGERIKKDVPSSFLRDIDDL